MKIPSAHGRTGLAITNKSIYFIGIFIAAFYLFHHHLFTNHRTFFSDLPDHIQIIRGILAGRLTALPHPGFHIAVFLFSRISSTSLESSATILLALAVTLHVLTIIILFRKALVVPCSASRLYLMALVPIIASAIYLPSFNKHIYLGQWYAYAWHNPTAIFTRPFITALFIYVATFYRNATSRKKLYVSSILLLLSTIIKPSFSLAFVPALWLYSVLRYRNDPRSYQKSLIITLPTLLVLLVQFIFIYINLPTRRDAIIVNFLHAWKFYSPNVGVSLLLGLAFPLAISLSRLKNILKNDAFKLVWLTTAIAIIQAVFFEEKLSFAEGNLFWGYTLCTGLLFMYASIELMNWLSEKGDSKNNLKKGITVLIFLMHILSGLIYTKRIFTGVGDF